MSKTNKKKERTSRAVNALATRERSVRPPSRTKKTIPSTSDATISTSTSKRSSRKGVSTEGPAKVAEPISPSIGEIRRPRWLALTLLLAAALLFSLLGQWQLTRAEEQKALEAKVAAASKLPVLNLNRFPVDEEGAYRRAVAEGTYDPAHQFYLDGRRHDGDTGYHVVTALRLAGTREYILVNRGWLPRTAEVSPIPRGQVRVGGVLMRPRLPALRLGEPVGVTRPYLDPKDYARDSGRSVAPLFLVAAAGGRDLAPIKIVHQSKKGMHEGYALQWFAFAAIAGIASLIIVLRRFRHV